MSYPAAQVENLLTRRNIDPRTILLVSEVGSTAHGIAISDQDDFDATAVRFETFPELIAGPSSRQSMMIRTQPDGHRSRLGDIDLNVYTLRKFAYLASKGNPSILAAIFSDRRHVDRYGIDWDTLAAKIASKRAGGAFLGYMRQQIERWTGERGQKSVTRPELVEKFGFDTKYAAHVIRLGWQGIEYMETARFTMPMPTEQADAIRTVRTGGYTEADALDLARSVEAKLKVAIDESILPDKPAPVDMWLTQIYAELVYPQISALIR